MRPNIGDKVSVDHPAYPGIWVVENNRGTVNAVLSQQGRPKKLRVPYTMLTAPTTAAPPPTPVTPTVYYEQGELVRVTAGRWAGLYVVLADKGGKTVTLGKLGGWNGQRLSSPRRGLVKLNLHPSFIDQIEQLLIEGAS
jgi:hypothetical protein